MFKDVDPPQIIHVIGVLALIWLISFPLMVKWVWDIGKKQETIIMRKRYIGLSLLSCSLCIIWIVIGLPIFIIQGNLNMFDIDESYEVAFGVATSIVYPVLNFGIIYALLIRIFMLYFFHNWTDVTLNSHWIIHIRKPSSKDREKDRKKMAEMNNNNGNKNNNNNNNNNNNTNNHLQNQLELHNKRSNTTSNNRSNNKSSAKTSRNRPGRKKSGHSDRHLRPHQGRDNGPRNNQNNQRDSSEDAIHNQIEFASLVVESWFIKMKPKYGTVPRVIRKLYLWYIIAICAVIFVSVMAAYPENADSYWPTVHYSTNFLLWLIPCCVIMFFWVKTPKNTNDTFFFS